MFRIGEFSKLTQVSIRMLRYYDETGLLKPAVIDKFTNFRLYSAEQISDINKIIFLRDLGFNVAEITIALNNWSNEFITEQLSSKRLEIEKTIKAEQDKLFRIDQAQKDIMQEKLSMHYNVTVKSIPSFQVASLRRTVPNYYSEVPMWKEMIDFMKVNNIPFPKSTLAIYHDAEYKETNVDIEICVAVTDTKTTMNDFIYRNTEPVPIMACIMVQGDFHNIAGAYRSFANWLEGHNAYKMAGQSRQVVHRGTWNEKNPDNYLTEIQIALEKI